jgi:ABC-2 type transport system ATP-binding protein
MYKVPRIWYNSLATRFFIFRVIAGGDMLNNVFEKYDPTFATLYVYNLWKSYDGVPALNGLSLYMNKGEVLGLIGPNGSGKTTTIKIILGLVKKDQGAVNVVGYDIDKEVSKYKSYLGYVPEAANIPEYLNSYEFLYYVGRIRNIPEDVLRKRIDELFSKFNLFEKKKSLITSLSKGMKQKLVFSSTLLEDPKILFLDEPFIGIDPEGQFELKSMIKELVKSGCSVLLSTHLLDLAERFCDRVAIISRGKNVATGNLQELKDLAHAGKDTTLEQLFLSLTRESLVQEKTESPLKQKKSFLSRLIRL